MQVNLTALVYGAYTTLNASSKRMITSKQALWACGTMPLGGSGGMPLPYLTCILNNFNNNTNTKNEVNKVK